MDKLYKIQEQDTTGWVEIEEPNCVKLTKEQASVRLSELMAKGFNPNHLRLQYDE